MTPLLSVDHLAAGYGDVRAVWDLSFEATAGSVVGLLGRNGAGKTTALRAVAGLNPIQAGSIAFDGVDLHRHPPYARAKAGIALVPDNRGILHQLSVEDNLVLGGYGLGESRRTLKGRLGAIYDRFGVLADRRRDRADRLSGGQQQMLAIATVLVGEPRLVLLDEPTGGLAPAIAAAIFDLIDELRAEGLGVVVADQNVDRVLALADHITVMDLGRVKTTGPASDFSDTEQLTEAYFGRGDRL